MAIGQQDVNVVFLLSCGPLVRLVGDSFNVLHTVTYVMMYSSCCHILDPMRPQSAGWVE